MSARIRACPEFVEAKDLLEWMDGTVEADYRYKDRSHLIEVALMELKEKLERTR